MGNRMIILFGATGMLGRYVNCVLKPYYKVMCIGRDEFDILNDDWNKLYKLLENCSASDIVINCAGVIPQKTDISNTDKYRLYFRINAVFPNKIQYMSDKVGFKFIHITTDCVFNGRRFVSSSYSEKDNIVENMSDDVYGLSKSLGEPAGACIIRTSIIGEELLTKKSLLEWVKSNADGCINGFNNHYWNGITCLTLANVIKSIIGENKYWCGVRHIYSPNVISKYELCNIINKIYKLNIIVNKFYTINSCNRTLTSLYNMKFKIPNIIDQIKIQKNFLLS